LYLVLAETPAEIRTYAVEKSWAAKMAAVEKTGLFVERGGSGSPTLLLLHGLAGNSAVWHGLLKIIQSRWPGRWVAPDLRGHGRSFHCAPYSFGVHAADVAHLFEPGEPVVCLAHSMGGVVAMVLASGWFGVQVDQVAAFGVKMEWRPEEIAKSREIARSPVHWFENRAQALQRYLRISGLEGLVAADSECAIRGITEYEGKFRLSMDPRANLAGAPLERIIPAMKSPLRLAAGENDPMVTLAQMRRYDPQAVIIEGLGHSPHVQAPERLWSFLEPIVQI
jgi:pimeloyl-ACP methyl ester carboxylesterase